MSQLMSSETLHLMLSPLETLIKISLGYIFSLLEGLNSERQSNKLRLRNNVHFQIAHGWT